MSRLIHITCRITSDLSRVLAWRQSDGECWRGSRDVMPVHFDRERLRGLRLVCMSPLSGLPSRRRPWVRVPTSGLTKSIQIELMTCLTYLTPLTGRIAGLDTLKGLDSLDSTRSTHWTHGTLSVLLNHSPPSLSLSLALTI